MDMTNSGGTLWLRGELDLANVAELTAALDAAEAVPAALRLDLTDVTFCDVLAGNAMESAAHRVQANGHHVVVTGLSGPLTRPGADTLFPALHRAAATEAA